MNKKSNNSFFVRIFSIILLNLFIISNVNAKLAGLYVGLDGILQNATIKINERKTYVDDSAGVYWDVDYNNQLGVRKEQLQDGGGHIGALFKFANPQSKISFLLGPELQYYFHGKQYFISPVEPVKNSSYYAAQSVLGGTQSMSNYNEIKINLKERWSLIWKIGIGFDDIGMIYGFFGRSFSNISGSVYQKDAVQQVQSIAYRTIPFENIVGTKKGGGVVISLTNRLQLGVEYFGTNYDFSSFDDQKRSYVASNIRISGGKVYFNIFLI